MFITDKVVFLVFFHLRLFDAIFLQFVFADPSGVLPPPRSACHLFSQSEQGRIIMYAGYSKEQVKKVICWRPVHISLLVHTFKDISYVLTKNMATYMR